MKDSAPEDAKGYVAVSINGGGHWQGFHVTDDHRRAGEGMLATVREANADAGPHPGTEVSSGLPSVSAAEQPNVGALAAVLASLMDKGTAVPQPPAAQAQAILESVGPAAWALNRITGERWLHVAATRGVDGARKSSTTTSPDWTMRGRPSSRTSAAGRRPRASPASSWTTSDGRRDSAVGSSLRPVAAPSPGTYTGLC